MFLELEALVASLEKIDLKAVPAIDSLIPESAIAPIAIAVSSIEYPKELKNLHNLLAEIMEKAAAKYCKSLPIPAEASVGTFWIH